MGLLCWLIQINAYSTMSAQGNILHFPHHSLKLYLNQEGFIKEWVQLGKDCYASILKYSLCKYTALGLQSNHLPHPNHSERASLHSIPTSTLFAHGIHMQLLKRSLVRTFSSSELQYEDTLAFGSRSVYSPVVKTIHTSRKSQSTSWYSV